MATLLQNSIQGVQNSFSSVYTVSHHYLFYIIYLNLR